MSRLIVTHCPIDSYSLHSNFDSFYSLPYSILFFSRLVSFLMLRSVRPVDGHSISSVRSDAVRTITAQRRVTGRTGHQTRGEERQTKQSKRGKGRERRDINIQSHTNISIVYLHSDVAHSDAAAPISTNSNRSRHYTTETRTPNTNNVNTYGIIIILIIILILYGAIYAPICA